MPTFYAGAEVDAWLALPNAPVELTGPVKAWQAPVLLPSYMPSEGDRNPMFLHSRVYQGSSGQVYPLPLVEQTGTEKQLWEWDAVHLENEFVRLVILPELGGRIHVAIDKINGQDFVCRRNVIEPMLAGLAGPRLTGGMEFDWPRYGRCWLVPAATHIEEYPDGARIVWCSSHDAHTRVKGMQGICLYPGRSYVEVKVRVFNRTSGAQTFAWWTTAAVQASERFEVFCPAGEDFFAGSDHARKAAVVCISDRGIAPGRKLTMRSNEQEDGSRCAELMSGTYGENLADGAVLAPYETKSFSEFWYSTHSDAPIAAANVNGALSLKLSSDGVRIGLDVTAAFPEATISVEWNGLSVASWTRNLIPGEPFRETCETRENIPTAALSVVVTSSRGRELLRHTPQPASPETRENTAAKQTRRAAEPPEPKKVGTTDQLFLIGNHLAQCRHATRKAEDYWQEALRRDERDVRCNIALAKLHAERGEFQQAEERLRMAADAIAIWGTNPPDGEPFYLLGDCLRYTGRDAEAYDLFQKAARSFAWRAASLYALAELELKAGRWENAPKLLGESLRLNADNNNARCLAAIVFRHFGRTAQAEALLNEALALDPLDAWARHLAGKPLQGDNQIRIDITFDYARAGLYQQAVEILTAADLFARDGSVPMVHYLLGYMYAKGGDLEAAATAYDAGGDAAPDRCFPYRLEELLVLESAVMTDPADARAFQYLGNWLFAHYRGLQALDCWKISVKLNDGLATSWRNLGLALVNVRRDDKAAREAYDRAFAANASDARVLYERDQLWKRMNVRPTERLKELEQHAGLVSARDDLSLELAALYNLTEQPEKAQAILAVRRFQPWEGEEQPVLEQYARTELKLGKRHLRAGEAALAAQSFRAALHSPENLGAVGHRLNDESEIYFWLGEASSAGGNVDEAIGYWQAAANRHTQCRDEAEAPFTEATVYSAFAKARLGERRESRNLMRQLWFYGRKLSREKGKPDYFAVSTPAASALFEEDASKRNRIRGLLLQTQARMGMAQWKLARRALEQVLVLDPNHERAAELITTFAYEQTAE